MHAGLKALKHPGLVGTLEMIVDGGLAACVIEANDGETMQQRQQCRLLLTLHALVHWCQYQHFLYCCCKYYFH